MKLATKLHFYDYGLTGLIIILYYATRAAQTNRLIVIMGTMSNCSWCRRRDKVIATRFFCSAKLLQTTPIDLGLKSTCRLLSFTPAIAYILS